LCGYGAVVYLEGSTRAQMVGNCMLTLPCSLCSGRSEFLTIPRNGGQKKLIGSGAGCSDAGSAAHMLEMYTTTLTTIATTNRGKRGAQTRKAGSSNKLYWFSKHIILLEEQLLPPPYIYLF
jgi:hypothetical protein